MDFFHHRFLFYLSPLSLLAYESLLTERKSPGIFFFFQAGKSRVSLRIQDTAHWTEEFGEWGMHRRPPRSLAGQRLHTLRSVETSLRETLWFWSRILRSERVHWEQQDISNEAISNRKKIFILCFENNSSRKGSRPKRERGGGGNKKSQTFPFRWSTDFRTITHR